MEKTTGDLMKRSEKDYQSAKVLFKVKDFNNACMLSQQCVEKCLKAIINHHHQEVPMTHNLLKLIRIIESEPIGVRVLERFKENASALTSAYLSTRYTSDDMKFEDVKNFTRLAEFCYGWTLNILNKEKEYQ